MIFDVGDGLEEGLSHANAGIRFPDDDNCRLQRHVKGCRRGNQLLGGSNQMAQTCQLDAFHTCSCQVLLAAVGSLSK